MSKYTPGPWTCDLSDLDAHEWDIYGRGDNSFWVANVSNEGRSSQNAANARLISAAPDLLMALRMLYDETADYIRLNNLGGMDNQCMQLARAAIAKATGN